MLHNYSEFGVKLYYQDLEIQIMEVCICALNLSFLYETASATKFFSGSHNTACYKSSTDNVPMIPPYQAIQQSLLHAEDVRKVAKVLH